MQRSVDNSRNLCYEIDEDKNIKKDDVSLDCIIVPTNHHRLQFTYCLWHSKKPLTNNRGIRQTFDETLKVISRFASVEQFWAVYTHLKRPSDLPNHSDFHLFKDGIKPMWEDEANKNGGKWIIRLRKGCVSRLWENLILAILGEQFLVGDEICGAVISVRFQEDIISIWNKTATDSATTVKIRNIVKRILNLPSSIIMEYKKHSNSIKYVSKFLTFTDFTFRDKTSFKNTDIFVSNSSQLHK